MMEDRERVTFARSVRLWDSPVFKDSVMVDDIAGALLASSGSNCVILGYIDHGTGQHQSNTVYSTSGVSPALTTIDGGTQQVKVLVADEQH